MKGLTFNFSDIIGVFIPLSFYCCLSGTILTLFIFPFSIKYNRLAKTIRKLAIIFALLWVLNIFANLFLLFTSPKNLGFRETKTIVLHTTDSKNNKNSL